MVYAGVYQYLVLGLLGLLVVMVAWGRVERHWVSLAILLALVVTGAVGLDEALYYVDWDVLGLILGMSILTVYLEDSGLMELTARFLRRRLTSPLKLVFWLSFTAGLVSIALENVSVVLLFAPIALRMARYLGVNPVTVLIGVALASNMAGSATMIGDPPAIITAGYFGLAFTDFIWYNGRPSMFFFTLIPMILACLMLAVIARKSLGEGFSSRVGVVGEEDSVLDKVFLAEASFFLALKIFLLSIRHVVHLPLSLVALISVGGLTITRLLHGDREHVERALRGGFEWKLLLFLVGVFVLSGAFAKHGLASMAAEYIISIGARNLVFVTSLLVWLSVLVSAFIDNVPYTTTMLPVVSSIAADLGVEPITIAWALLLGTTLGGNLTYIGASANVTAVRILEKNGYNVSFKDFIKISLPFNTISVVTGWILYEVFWIILG